VQSKGCIFYSAWQADRRSVKQSSASKIGQEASPARAEATDLYLRCSCNHVLDVVSMSWAIDMSIMPLVCLVLDCRQHFCSATPATTASTAQQTCNLNVAQLQHLSKSNNKHVLHKQLGPATRTACDGLIPCAVAMVIPRAFSSGACCKMSTVSAKISSCARQKA